MGLFFSLNDTYIVVFPVEKTNNTTKQGCENYVYYQIEEGVIKCECESACK